MHSSRAQPMTTLNKRDNGTTRVGPQERTSKPAGPDPAAAVHAHTPIACASYPWLSARSTMLPLHHKMMIM